MVIPFHFGPDLSPQITVPVDWALKKPGYLLMPGRCAHQTAQQRPHAGRVLAPARGGDALLPPLRPGDVQPGTQPRLPPRRAVARGGGGASQSRRLRLRLGGGRGQFSSLLPKPQTNKTGFAQSLKVFESLGKIG